MPSVCPRCIEETSLARFIEANACDNECTYCGRSGKQPHAVPLDGLLAHMRERLSIEYEDPDNSVGYDSEEGGYQLETMDGYDLLDEFGLGWDLGNEQLRDDLAEEFSDHEWVHIYPYSLTEESKRSLSWSGFVDIVKHRVRYLLFPPDMEKDDEVTAPAEMLDELGELFKTHDLISVLKAGTELVRIRLHKPGEVPANTLSALGPPPVDSTRFANRMSPAGVSMFYAAFDETTAMAETYVRHDGQPAQATIAVFSVVEDLNVLNLLDLPAIPSIFDEDETNIYRAAIGFLHEFNQDFTRPITKDGREHVGYVPSQVVTEFVRYRLAGTTGKPLHGILYRSARRETGVGCVLFYAYEDLNETAFGFQTKAPFELLPERTKTVDIDTNNVNSD
jgi:hypothetical protein